MEKILRIFFLISLIVYTSSSRTMYGQEKEGMVKYTPDFRFNDGIYLNFDQVKLNSPIPKAKLLTSVDYNDREFFKKIFEMDKIYFYDGMGMRQEIEKNTLFGVIPAMGCCIFRFREISTELPLWAPFVIL
jgi:hypothetical protein